MAFLTSDPKREDHEIGLFTGRQDDGGPLVHFCWRVPDVADVKAFYQKFGFIPSPTHPLHLFLLVKDILANLGP